METKYLILIAAGAFALYNLFIVGYALLTKGHNLLAVMFISRYAPWLLVSTGVTAFLMGA